jgi:hypothetical protein
MAYWQDSWIVVWQWLDSRMVGWLFCWVMGFTVFEQLDGWMVG